MSEVNEAIKRLCEAAAKTPRDATNKVEFKVGKSKVVGTTPALVEVIPNDIVAACDLVKDKTPVVEALQMGSENAPRREKPETRVAIQACDLHHLLDCVGAAAG